jgi:ketosteroid isomerase-like protein
MKRSIAVLGMVLAVAITGCATKAAPKGQSDEEMISGTLARWKEAIIAKDIEKMMTCYSDKFQDQEGRGKADVKEFIKGVIDAGYFDGVKVGLENSKTTVTGATATVLPIDLSGSMGSISISLTLSKEGDQWLITKSGQA